MIKHIQKVKSPTRGRADFKRLDRMTYAEIEQTSPPELANLSDHFWAGATFVVPVAKRAISLRVDEDVLDWFKSLGPRYQSRMNAVLRHYKAQIQKKKTVLKHAGTSPTRR